MCSNSTQLKSTLEFIPIYVDMVLITKNLLILMYKFNVNNNYAIRHCFGADKMTSDAVYCIEICQDFMKVTLPLVICQEEGRVLTLLICCQTMG